MLLVYLYYGCLVGSALLEDAVSCVCVRSEVGSLVIWD